MTTRSTASILASLKKADTQAQTDINDLAAKFKGKAREAIRVALLPDVAKLYKVKLIAGAGKATGTMVLDSEASNYEAARKFLGRILAAIAPADDTPTSHKRIAVPKALRDDIVKSIIAAGLDKTQFNALLAQVRDSIDFA